MSEEGFHQIDPNGDVVLTLRNPNTIFFAFWQRDLSAGRKSAKEPPTALDICGSSRDGEVHGTESISDAPPEAYLTGDAFWAFLASSQEKKKKKKKKKRLIFDSPPPIPIDDVGSSAVSYREPQGEVIHVAEPVLEVLPEPKPELEVCPEPELDLEAHAALELEEADDPVRYLVSSRHLALASRYFSTKLSGPWIEATVKHLDGCYHMDATDWDSEAFLILMQVIHGKTRSVPRRVDVDMLARLAVLVDYYDCHEVIEIYYPMWINPLTDELPASYGRNAVLWLLISHVFKQDDIFQRMTQIVVLKSAYPLQTKGLPIPSSLVDKIDRRRQDAIESILGALQKLLDSFRNDTAGCSFECSSILLGALTKEMAKYRLLDPKPAAPYLGYSIENTEKIVRAFQNPHWSHDHMFGGLHPCTLLSMIDCHLNADFDKSKLGFSLSETVSEEVNGTQKRGMGKIISFSTDEEPAPPLEDN